jgi:hypothetical protein
MKAMIAALRIAMWLSAGAGIFLAFGWPFVVSPDPAGEAFRLVAIATVVVFLVSLATLVFARALAGHDPRPHS